MNKTSGCPSARPTRRAFAHSLAALAATPLLPATATTQQPDKPKPPAASDATAATTAALADLARQLYGRHLTEEQRQPLERSLGRMVRLSQLYRRAQLKNSDEPPFVFRADLA